MSLVRFKTNKEERPLVDSMTVFNAEEVDTKKQPMFFGKPLGIQRYDSYKYPIFDKLTTQQLGYFWRPEEVSLQKDRADYQTLRPEQKHIFTSNLEVSDHAGFCTRAWSWDGFYTLLQSTRVRSMYGGLGVHGDDPQSFIYSYH